MNDTNDTDRLIPVPGGTVEVGAWCTRCGFFYPQSDPDDPVECGHVMPVRQFAAILLLAAPEGRS